MSNPEAERDLARIRSEINGQWGKDKEYSITVRSKSDDVAGLLLGLLNKPEIISDEDKVKFVDGLDIRAIGFSTLESNKEKFETIGQLLLPALAEEVRQYVGYNPKIDILLKTLFEAAQNGGIDKAEAQAIISRSEQAWNK